MARKKKPAPPLIGQKIRFVPQYEFPMNGQNPRAVSGIITYVHPDQRYVMVEYRYPESLWRPSGKLRECLLWCLIPNEVRSLCKT